MHDPEQAITYGKKLLEYANEAREDLMIVMRVYFEKCVVKNLGKGNTHPGFSEQASNDRRLEGFDQRSVIQQ